MTAMIPTRINDRWTLVLPEHRAVRPEWPVWERERLASMHERIGPGDVVYDIGAEEGDLPALWASWVGETGGVVLVEPNPRVWPNIRAIWAANELPEPLAWYVGFAADVIDEAPPNLNIDARMMMDGWPACAHGPIIGDHGFRHLAQEADATPRITIDALVARTGAVPTAITMDIEGAEWHALTGAALTLSLYRPLVWVSVHPDVLGVLYDRTPEDVDALMQSHGYQGRLLAEDHERHVFYAPQS